MARCRVILEVWLAMSLIEGLKFTLKNIDVFLTVHSSFHKVQCPKSASSKASPDHRWIWIFHNLCKILRSWRYSNRSSHKWWLIWESTLRSWLFRKDNIFPVHGWIFFLKSLKCHRIIIYHEPSNSFWISISIKMSFFQFWGYLGSRFWAVLPHIS